MGTSKSGVGTTNLKTNICAQQASKASKQSKAKSKIKRVSRLCKSQDYLLISRLRKFPLCIDNTATKMWCAGKSNSSLTVYAGQQPPLSLTQPISALEKTPKMYMSTGFANLNKKEAFPSVSKTPKMFANFYIKKKLSQVLQEHPRRLQISKYIFFPSVLN